MEDKELQSQMIEVISGANIPQSESQDFITQVLDVEKSAWPLELQASREKFKKRLEVFPQGFIVLKTDGKIQAVTTSQICTYDPQDQSPHTWDAFTDSGTIEKTHNPDGNALYVVSVGVSKDAQGAGLGRKLVSEQQNLAKSLGLKYLFLGARIPGYLDYIKTHGEISVENYLNVKNEKDEPIDPEIRFYQRQGLRPAKIIPDFEPDTNSRDYGVVMVWQDSNK